MAWQRSAPGFILSFSVALAVGVTLVVLAIPRLAAGISEQQGTWAIAEIRSGTPPSKLDVRAAAASLRGANKWVDTAPRRAALARLHYADALRQNAKPEERRKAFLLSQEASRQAIALNPALPEPWLRLAQSEYGLNKNSPQMIRALAMTYRTGRYNRFSVFAMTELAFLTWAQLESDTRAIAIEQIAFAVKQRNRRLVAISERLRATPIVRRALRRQPELLAKFDREVTLQRAGG